MASVDNAGTPGVPDVVLASGYDAAGNRASLSATIGGAKDFLNSYSYNTLSELNQIDQQSQTGGNAVAPKSIYFGLDSIGDITEIDRANSVTVGPNQNGPAYSLLSYSATTGLLTGINHEHMGTSLDDLAYTYDPLARVHTFSTIDGTATYGYDPTSQLTSTTYVAASGHTEPPNFAVSFDPNGNRTSANGISTTVGADNHLSSDGTFNFAYDPAGNVSTRTRISNDPANDYKTVYDWDYRNRLTDVSFYNNSGTLTQHVHYVYDVWDELIERDLDPNGSGTYAQIVHYVWDGGENGPGQGNIVLAFSGSQQLTARYLNGPNTSAFDQYFTALAEEDVTSPASPGTVTYPLLDQQGTVTDVVDVNGVLLDHIINEATGALFSESNPSVTHIGAFQGGYFDPVTGFVKLGERWLNTFDATWTSPDPIGLAGDENQSRYASNDPVNLSDPSGLIPRGGGHHNVPWSVFMGEGESAITGFSDEVIGVFQDALEKLFYNHGYDAWNGITHSEYNTAVREELIRAMGGVGRAGGFTADQARAFVASILSGECPKGGNAANWQKIAKFAQGLARSNTVAAAAMFSGVESKAELKALAQLDSLSRVNKGLTSEAGKKALAVINDRKASKAAKAFYSQWMGKGAGVFRKAAIAGAVGKKLIAPLFIVIAAGRCTQALAKDGIAGASHELANELFMADAIESLANEAFAPVGKAFDNALEAGQMNHMLKRFRNQGIDPKDMMNMRRAIDNNRPGAPD